jgi:hypothetical protein
MALTRSLSLWWANLTQSEYVARQLYLCTEIDH